MMGNRRVKGMMKMGDRAVPTTGGTTNNPIQLLSNYPPLVETSIVDQDQTSYKLSSSGVISHQPPRMGRRNPHFAVRPAFGVIATIVIYSPGKPGPITAYDFAGATPDGQGAQRRSYTKLYQTKFGRGFYVAQFLLNNIAPIDGSQTLVFKHPPCKRRAVLADQIVNVLETDKQAFNSSGKRGSATINSTATDTTGTDLELVYGAIAIGGNFRDFIAPPDYIPIGIAQSSIDEFDVSLRTYYKLTSATGSYRIGATSAGQFSWAAGVQTFKAFDI